MLGALWCVLLLGAGGPVRASDATIPTADLGGFPAPVQAAITAARSSLEEALAEPGQPDRQALAWGQYGDVLFVHELLAQAREAYARARALQPDNQSWAYLQALVEVGANDPAAATAFLDEVLELAPDDVPALLRRGRMRLEAGQPDLAARDFERARGLAPQAPAALAGLGQVALAGERYAAAAEYLEQALALDPAASQLHHSLGMAYRGLGEIERARYHLERRGNRPASIVDPLFDAVRSKSRSSQFYVEMGLDLAATGRLEDAALAMQRAIQLDPDSRPALLNAGELLARLGNTAASRMVFERLVSLDPDDSRAWFYLGQLDELEGEPETALERYGRALAADAEESDARLALADLMFSRGDFRAAAVEYQRLRDGAGRVEEQTLYGLLLGASLLGAGDCERALAAAEQTLQTTGQAAVELTAMVVRLRATCGRNEPARRQAAVVLAEALYQQVPGQVSAEALAMAYAAAGSFDEAVELQMQAIFEALKSGGLEGRPDLRENLQRYESGQGAAAAYAPEHPLFSARRLGS
nr:tetratricopeptide repeat protein [Thioalkalivibrio sp. XN8]